MIDARYDGYIARQQAEIKRQAKAETQQIPMWFEPWTIPGLRSEAAEALKRFRPATMGQANRLSGINPADMTLLAVHLKRPKGHASRFAKPVLTEQAAANDQTR